MSRFKQFKIIMENAKQSEILDKDILIFLKGAIDLDEVIAYRESVDSEDNIKPYTFVYMSTGIAFCLNIKIEEFIKLMSEEVDSDEKASL